MANTFILTSKTYDGRYLEVTCEQTPNVEENTSEISWTLTAAGGDSGYYSTGPTTLLIGGQQVWYCKRKSYSTKAFPAAKGSVSGTLTVNHDENGGCTLTVSLETAIYTQTLSEVTGDWQLDTILRASTIRASDANIGSCATVVVSRRSGSFAHSIAYRFGALGGYLNREGTLTDEEDIFSETTVNFLLPEDFYVQLRESPRGSCCLTCTTYSGDTVIGEEDCSFTVTADPELCSPGISGQVEAADEKTAQLTGGGVLIPGVSAALCTVDASGRKGAYIVSVTAGGQPVEEGQVILEGWALPTVPVVATDSRGYKTTCQLTVPSVSYVELTNEAQVKRPEPTANSAILTLRGSCYSGSFGLEDNSLEITAEFDGRQLTLPVTVAEDHTYLLETELPELSYDRSYTVTVTARDRAMETVRTLTVQKGIPVFHWGERDFQFHVPVDLPALTIAGIPLEEYIRSIVEG